MIDKQTKYIDEESLHIFCIFSVLSFSFVPMRDLKFVFGVNCEMPRHEFLYMKEDLIIAE